jgi:acyl dehydratase
MTANPEQGTDGVPTSSTTGGPRLIEQRGLYFEELEEGVVYAHRPGRTVTETDNVLFTTMTMITQLTQGTIIAQLGLTDVSFPGPLFHGDTLYTETVITGKRLSGSRPGQGIVTMKHTGRNQDGTVVALATRSCLMWTREAHMQAQTEK